MVGALHYRMDSQTRERNQGWHTPTARHRNEYQSFMELKQDCRAIRLNDPIANARAKVGLEVNWDLLKGILFRMLRGARGSLPPGFPPTLLCYPRADSK